MLLIVSVAVFLAVRGQSRNGINSTALESDLILLHVRPCFVVKPEFLQVSQLKTDELSTLRSEFSVELKRSTSIIRMFSHFFCFGDCCCAGQTVTHIDGLNQSL